MTSKSNSSEIPILKSILNDIADGNIAPVYLLYGEEDFLIKKSLDNIIREIVPEENKDFNLQNIDGTVILPEEIIDFAETYPFLPGKKLIVINDYPSLSPSSSVLNSEKIIHIIESFHKAEQEESAVNLISIAGLEFEDIKKISKTEFIEKISSISSESLSEGQKSILENMYIYIIENIEDLESIRDKKNFSSEDLLEDYISTRQSDFSCFIFVSSVSISKRSKLFKLINKKGKVVEFSASKDNIDVFIAKLVRDLARKEIKITSTALEKLKEKTGINFRQIYNEIDKIVDYLGDNKVINDKDIDSLVVRTETEKIYQLSDALADKNSDKAFLALNHLLEDQVYPLQIISGIITKFRFLLQIKLLIEEGLLEEVKSYPFFMKKIYPELKDKTIELMPLDKRYNILKQHPFVVFKSIQQSAKYPLNKLKACFNKLLKVDYNLKFSSRPPKTVLELLIIELI